MKQSKTILFIAVRDHYATGVRVLASLLREKGYNAEILVFKEFDFTAPTPITDTEWDLLAQSIRERRPDLIGVSLTSIPVVDEALFFAFLRKTAPQAVLTCGGFGPTFEPRRFLEAGADWVVRGEGEGALLDMAEALHSNGDFSAIRNIAWLENGEVKENPLRPLVDLATVPDSLSGDEHITFIERNSVRRVDPMLTLQGMYPLNTSRGCVGRCTYCSGGNWLDLYQQECGHIKRYRARPIENVIRECEAAKRRGATYFLFMDEYFIRPEEEFYTYFREYKRRVDVPFGLMVHTAFLDKDENRFKVFFDAGIYDVEIGIQSASQHVSRDIFHRKVSLDLQKRTIQKFHDYWISTAVDFITGHSLESEEDYQDSLAFVKTLPFDPGWPDRTHLSVFSLALLPGAPIADIYPQLRTDKLPAEQIAFRRWSLYLRHILKDDDEFFAIYKNEALRADPRLLKPIFDEIFNRLQVEYWQKTLARLEGREVWFWGAGREYQTHKHMFRKTRPKGILLDSPPPTSHFDGLPVMHPDDALASADNTPIIMFTSVPGRIAAKVLRKHPGYSDLIACYHAVYKTPFLS